MQWDWTPGLIAAGLVAIAGIAGSISGAQGRIKQATTAKGWLGGAKEVAAAGWGPLLAFPTAICIVLYPASLLILVPAEVAFVWLRYRHRKEAK